VLMATLDKETDTVPTYQYSCTACGSALEAQQSFSDESLTVCPECGGKLRKVFSAVGVVFKGSGFYRNDSRVSSNGAKPSESSSDASTGESASSGSDSGSSKSSGSSGSGGSGGSSGGKESAKAGASA
jgi:putative FmdB family regulatory protein